MPKSNIQSLIYSEGTRLYAKHNHPGSAKDVVPDTGAEPKVQKKQKTAATASATLSTASQPNDGQIDPSVVREKAQRLSVLVYRQIKRQMKWVPSCRMGTARWSCSLNVPNAAVFFRLFRLEPTDAKGKKWKQKKIPVGDFEYCVGEVEASIRYGALRIMGPHVNLKWNEEDLAFTVSGKYGLWHLRVTQEGENEE
ncbi:hypothetical protein AAE478_008323 [Parahypoxylon ruwenzoriense]